MAKTLDVVVVMDSESDLEVIAEGPGVLDGITVSVGALCTASHQTRFLGQV